MAVEIGSTVEGIVVRIADFGAIVRLAGGGMGLVHISEVADAYVRDIRDYMKENDRIVVKVLRLNQKGRYELSTKQADQAETKPQVVVSRTRFESRDFETDRFEPVKKEPASFEERLSRFMKDSDERQGDIKRSIENKRGGNRR